LGEWLKEASSFDTMITPVIIKIVFWIGVIGCVIGGIGMFFNDSGVVGGLLCILLGPVVVRIYCELIIVVFKIFQALKQIENNLPGNVPGYSISSSDLQSTPPDIASSAGGVTE
jgi:hypothetical protein